MKKFMAVLLAGLVLMSIFSTAFAGCNHRWRGWINYDKNPPTCQKAGAFKFTDQKQSKYKKLRETFSEIRF